jgi:hypothetical protein
LERTLNQRWETLRLVALYLFGLTAAVVTVFLLVSDRVRLAVAVVAMLALFALAMTRLRLGILATFVFLILLGDLRRILLPVAEWSGKDPLLLVGPAFAVVTVGYTWASGNLSFDTPAAKCMLVLMGIMLLQVFNPRQGGLIVGVAGLMFQLVPLLWFWLGRAYGDRAFLHVLLFRAMLALSGLAMVFGLYQSYFGYLPYQLDWFYTAGYGALGSPETGLAPITFFASGTEHAVFVNLGVVLLWSLVLLRKEWLALLPIPVFLTALLVTGTRGPVAKILLVMSGLWAVMGRSLSTWLLRGGLAVSIAALGLIWTLAGVTQQIDAPDHVERRLNRQAEEFVHGSGSAGGRSSAVGHLKMMVWGYRSAFQQPLGKGLGAGTKAGKKFGDSGGSTETDLGDSFLALGIPGGVAYHILVGSLIVAAFRFWQQERSLVSMVLLGFMGITFFGWLRGGMYGVTPLLWFCLGAVDRLQASRMSTK